MPVAIVAWQKSRQGLDEVALRSAPCLHDGDTCGCVGNEDAEQAVSAGIADERLDLVCDVDDLPPCRVDHELAAVHGYSVGVGAGDAPDAGAGRTIEL